jgi:hypothetical protein
VAAVVSSAKANSAAKGKPPAGQWRGTVIVPAAACARGLPATVPMVSESARAAYPAHRFGQGTVRVAMTVEPSSKLNCDATGQPP